MIGFDYAAFDINSFNAQTPAVVVTPVMPPTKVIRVGGTAGDFNINHGLGRVPYAACPVSQTPGILRLAPALYDDLKVYLNASANSVDGILALW